MNLKKLTNILKKIASYFAIIVSVPLLIASIVDYISINANIDIIIFIMFLFPFISAVKYLNKNKKNSYQLESHISNNKLTYCTTTEEQNKAVSKIEQGIKEVREDIANIEEKLDNQQNAPVILIDGLDEYFIQAGKFIIEKDKASIGMIQRMFKIGFNRAARIMDQLYAAGVVGPEEGTKPREVLMSVEQFEKAIENSIFDYERNITYTEKEYNKSRIDLYNNKFDYMEGHDFEYFCADILRKNGFVNVEVTQGSRDQGIDIIAFKDGIKYGIQCKCYSSDIGNKAVQEAFSGKTFYSCHVGVVLTNRYFTTSAKELAEKNGVLLWDRDKLNEMIENQV